MPIVEFWIALGTTVLLVASFSMCLFLDKRRSVWVDRRFPGTGRTKVLAGDYGAAGRTEHRMYTTERLYRAFRASKWPAAGALMHLTPVVIVTDPIVIEHVLSEEFVKVQSATPEARDFRTRWDAFEDEHFEQLLRVANEESRSLAKALGAKRQSTLTEDVRMIVGPLLMRILARVIFGRRWNESRCFLLPASRAQRPPNILCSVLASRFPKLANILAKLSPNQAPTILEDLVHSLGSGGSVKTFFLEYLRQQESEPIRLTFPQKAACMLELLENVFFMASTTMTACLYELAQQPELQDSLCQRLQGSDGSTNIDDLEAVIGETLRKYPPVDEISFVSASYNRLPVCDLIVPRNTRVTIPIYAIHRDAEYYPNPTHFDPTRPMIRSGKRSIRSCLYQPLGPAPYPIGANWAMMLVRVALGNILTQHQVRMACESPTTLEMSPSQLVPYPREKVILLIRRAGKAAQAVRKEGNSSLLS